MSFLAGPQSDASRKLDPDATIDITQSVELGRSSVEILEANVLREMEIAWHEGARPPAELWLDRHPQIRSLPEVAVRIIYEEVCLREERGELVTSAEVYRRFPQWHDPLKVLLDCHRLVQPGQLPARYPVAGERLGELRLLREIDRGAVGRVFLATQPELSDRLLVVKLTPRSGGEHLSLARLQHTHIVPLYLVQDFPEEGVRALCMPYLGGTSFAHVLDALKQRDPAQRKGRDIADAVLAEKVEAPLAPSQAGPAIRFLERATYIQAICWIGSCVADALHYAHQRGLVHLDIKPSNVLLAGDGQPMLLDFHLARELVAAGGGPIDRLGGTRGYMSPEQELAADAVREGRPLARALDGRSDIYSLGVLMYESLAGQLPAAEEAKSRRRLRHLNPQTGRGMEDMVHKCLAQDPAARYANAGELAADLRRHFADLPLYGVPNRSIAERWQKWRRRKPHAVAVLAVVLAAALVIGSVGLMLLNDRLSDARLSLDQARQQIESRDYTAAIEMLEAGSNAIRWLPGEYDLKQALRAGLVGAKRLRLAETLHRLVERLQFLDSFDTVPVTRLRELADGCAAVWRVRSSLAEPPTAHSNPEVERQVRTDLLDLALLWADLRMRIVPDGEQAAERRRAVALLDEARQLYGASPILDLARREYVPTAEPEAALDAAHNTRGAQTAWEHFAVGRSFFRSGELEQAEGAFRRAIRLEPNAFWPNFYLALSAYGLEHFDEALNAGYVCVALSPKSAECFYNRALAHQALHHNDEALKDFNRAIQIEPSVATIIVSRGMLLREMRRFPEAMSDFETALAAGANAAKVYYEMALVDLARQDRLAAIESIKRSLAYDPAYAPAAALKAKIEK